jgi:hypothetical protein
MGTAFPLADPPISGQLPGSWVTGKVRESGAEPFRMLRVNKLGPYAQVSAGIPGQNRERMFCSPVRVIKKSNGAQTGRLVACQNRRTYLPSREHG